MNSCSATFGQVSDKWLETASVTGPEQWLIALKAMFHFWFAGIGMYVFLRRRGNPAAACYAGGIFFLGDYDGLSAGGNRVFPCYPIVTPAGDSDVYVNLIVDPTGDLNCDDEVNAFDIEPFLMALFEPNRYRAVFPDCDLLNGDTDDNGSVDAFDIEGFLQLLFS